jgi:tetratricopeptide (TPR) repeat protein
MTPAELCESLRGRTTLAGLAPAAALEELGLLIDLSLDFERPDGLRHAISLGAELAATSLAPADAATLDYFLGNAWDSVRSLGRREDPEVWEWQQEELENQIVHFRRSLRSAAFEELSPGRRCQILTNLGNAMSVIGRFVEAAAYFDRALQRDPAFAMARGNRGLVLTRYAHALYDPGHAIVIFRRALDDVKVALGDSGLHPAAREGFRARAEWLEELLKINPQWKPVDLDAFSLGPSDAEAQYRLWCLEHHLFLSSLNDLGPHAIAAHDVLTTPSMTAKLDEGPTHPGFFNQMKQEFVSARYLYYESVSTGAPHFSDRGVLLYNTLDYPAYSLAVERVKCAFRMSYSLLDKIAYFLNDYFELGIPETRVSFRTVWYEGQERRHGLRSEFRRRQNWPLRGLFWLSKDLYEPTPGFREAVEPDGQALAEIRNHLEHKYLKIHEIMVPREIVPDSLADRLAFSVERRDFEAKTLRLLRMARAALIYLSLAIYAEEQEKSAAHGGKPVLPMPLSRWEDEWKT